MQPYSILHKVAVIIGIVALIIVSYGTILVNNFKTPEATSDFFRNSNTYYYIAEIVKTDIRSKYPLTLRTNVIQLAAADQLLNFVITPNLVERIALPALRLRERVAQLPLSFAANNLVLNTKQYTDQLSSTLSSLNLPSTITDAGNKLIASVPSQITVVDTQKNPNSILVSITKTRIFFENVQTFLRIMWIILIITLVTFFVINLLLPKRFLNGLLWIFLTSGIVLLILSFLAPVIASGLSSNPDPVAGILKDDLANGMVNYYFSRTRTLSLIYIFIGIVFFLLYRYLPYQKVKQWENKYLFTQPSTQSAPRQKTAHPTSKSRTRKSSKK